MDVRGLVWLGTRTDRFVDMRAFCADVLGLQLEGEREDLAQFRLPDGSLVEVFGPSSPGGGHPERGAVVGFHVDDVDAAVAEVERAGCAVEHVGRSGGYAWAYVRAPDGNLYELTSGPYGASWTSRREGRA